MRKDIHPENYRLVAFKDMSNDDVFLTKSTAEAKETITVDGVEYPLVKLKFLELHIHTTLVKLNWLTPLVELTSSRTSTRNSRKKRRRPSRSHFSTKYIGALDGIRERFLFLQ